MSLGNSFAAYWPLLEVALLQMEEAMNYDNSMNYIMAMRICSNSAQVGILRQRRGALLTLPGKDESAFDSACLVAHGACLAGRDDRTNVGCHKP